MAEVICPKYTGCPIFTEKAPVEERYLTFYKNLYCKAGRKGFTRCKRYIVSEKAGKAAPAYIMPNSFYTIEEIIQIIEEEEAQKTK